MQLKIRKLLRSTEMKQEKSSKKIFEKFQSLSCGLAIPKTVTGEIFCGFDYADIRPSLQFWEEAQKYRM